jgi:uncharacterized membrane protein YfcA
MLYDAFVLIVSIVAAAVASITGFGIGSLLTPTLAIATDTKIAVAAVSLPHFVGTAIRFVMLRASVDRRVLWRFGVASAAGGLTGALLHRSLASPWLSAVFGLLLIFVAVSEWTALARRMRFHGSIALVAGTASGLLGGLVGNQGGIRSAALLGFDLPKRTFVATATAVGLVVDLARMPVYLATAGHEILDIWRMVAIATAGVVLGTVFGGRLLSWIPESRFRTFVAAILAALGLWMLIQAAIGST